MDRGLLLLRLIVGSVLFAHGLQKTTKLLHGTGVEGAAAEMAADDFRGGTVTAVAGGATQLAAGFGLTVGLLTPVAAAADVGVMLVAASTKRGRPVWVQFDGAEYPLVLVGVGAVLALSGPGSYSLDRVLGLTTESAVPGLLAITTGAVGAGVFIRLFHRRDPVR